MAHREKIPFQTDVLVEFIHPTDITPIPNNPLDNTGDGSTCSYKVFDADKDEKLSANEASGQTTLFVTNAGVFQITDVVEVILNDGTVHDAGVVTAIDPVAGTIDVTTALASAADSGNRVRVRLGAQITMTEFGTPVLGELEYGFRATLSDTHPGLKIDVKIDVEIRFVGAVAGGLDVLDIQCGIIKPKSECTL